MSRYDPEAQAELDAKLAIAADQVVRIPNLEALELIDIQISPRQRQAMIETMHKRTPPNRGVQILHPLVRGEDKYRLHMLGLIMNDMETLSRAGIRYRAWIFREDR